MHPDDTLAACSVFKILEPGLAAYLAHYNIKPCNIGHVSDNGFVRITAMDMYVLPGTSLCIHEAVTLSISEITEVFLSYVMYCRSPTRSLRLP